jgi:ABC-type transport system substrate-binding protein
VKIQTTDYFKPTRDFNADDVVFTFDRMLNKNNAFRKAYPTEFPYFTDMGMDENITKVEKLDANTVKFTLKSIDAAFLQNLAMSFASIQSAEYADKLLKAGPAAAEPAAGWYLAPSSSSVTRKMPRSALLPTSSTGTRLMARRWITWCLPSPPIRPCAIRS